MRCDGLIRTERARMPRARASARAWRAAWQTALSRLGRLPSALRSARPPPARAERLKLLRALRAFSSPLERACACVSAAQTSAMAGKGTGDGGGNATAVALTPNDEALQQAALAVVRQCMGGEGYKTDAEARAVCPALVAMLGEKSVGVRRNACAALAALAGCHGASKGCGGALMELKAPAAAAKCLADGAEARDGPLAANAAQAVAALANVVGA